MSSSGSKRSREKREKQTASVAQAANSSGDERSSDSSVSAPNSKRQKRDSSSSSRARRSSSRSAAAASSSASSSAASAAVSKALVKMGDGGKWRPFKCTGVADMDAVDLLRALKKDDIFGGDLEGVKKLSACAVFIYTGELQAEQKVPTVAEEADTSKFVELVADMTVRDAATEGNFKGERLFISVRLPGGAAASAAGPSALSAARVLSDLPSLDATHHISRVVASIRSGAVTVDKHGHLRLPADLNWPIATNSVLFVRKFYAPLLEKVLDFCKPRKPGQPDSAQRRIVTGQPGIGKSVWIWYVIYRILREAPSRTIILAVHDTQEVFVIPPFGPLRHVVLSEMALSCFNYFRDLGKEPLLIADSLLPPVLSIPTLVVSSPGRLAKRDLTNMLNSYKDEWCYMPVPTEEEVLQLRKTCFTHLDVAGVTRRIELWGPIPRHVLVKTKASQQRVAWKKASSVELKTLVALSRGHATGGAGVGDELDAPHRLVHERAAGQDADPSTPAGNPENERYYERGVVSAASPAMLRYIAERLIKEGEWNARFLVESSVGIGSLGALRGLKFEELALSMLEEGATLKCRRLLDGGARTVARTAPDVFTLSVPNTSCVRWSSVDELKERRRTSSLLVPVERNKAGLDALVWDKQACHHWPLDCTVASSHGVHAKGVSDAVRALGWTRAGGWCTPAKGDKHIRYLWVVPEDRFTAWQVPQPAKKGSDSTEPAKEAFASLAQYAVCMPASATTTQAAKALKAQGVKLPDELVV